jgi:hypothetical protein
MSIGAHITAVIRYDEVMFIASPKNKVISITRIKVKKTERSTIDIKKELNLAVMPVMLIMPIKIPQEAIVEIIIIPLFMADFNVSNIILILSMLFFINTLVIRITSIDSRPTRAGLIPDNSRITR